MITLDLVAAHLGAAVAGAFVAFAIYIMAQSAF